MIVILDFQFELFDFAKEEQKLIEFVVSTLAVLDMQLEFQSKL